MEQYFSPISALKIYLRRGDVKKSSHWWHRLVEKPLSTHLVQAALQSGIVHAAVNLSHVGYTRDATKISHDLHEIPVHTLPVCVELLAPKRLLEQFIREQARHLKNTTMVLVDGVHIADLFLSDIEMVRLPIAPKAGVAEIQRCPPDCHMEISHITGQDMAETRRFLIIGQGENAGRIASPSPHFC